MANNGNKTICGCCGSLFTRLIGLGVGIAYAVFGIRALRDVSNNTIRKTCAGSTMWSALLVQVIFAVSGALKALGCSGGSKKKDGDNGLAALVSLAVLTGLASWGIHETRTSCVKEHFGNSDVRLMARGWSLAVFAVLALCVLGLAAVCVMPDRCQRWMEKFTGSEPTIKDAVADAHGVYPDPDPELGATTTAGVVPDANTTYKASP